MTADETETAATTPDQSRLRGRVEDAINLAQNAMRRVSSLTERVDGHDEELASLRDRVIELELRVSELGDNRAYGNLSREERIGMVREHGFSKASSAGRPVKLDYNAVKWEVFDGEPSPSYCYDLMRWAAGQDPETGEFDYFPGFEFREPGKGGGTKHLLTKPGEVRRANPQFSSAKNPAQEEAAD